MGVKFIFLAIFLAETIFLLVNAEPIEDKQALLDFIHNISHSRPLNCDVNSSACNSWTGVSGNHDKSRVIAIRLPGFGFHGSIPSNTLSRLSALQILSVRSNSISGSFPADFSNLGNLTLLYLELNKFSGPLHLDFSVSMNLSVINLSNNGFNGSIPYSIANLTHLTTLNLANNSFSGVDDAMPEVVKRLKEVSVAKREFQQQMEVVGNIKHENIAALRAYYYSKDEKLIVYDYYSSGSLSAILHTKRGENQSPLDWETRLRIAIGAARGVAHIHTQNGGKLVHGNIKASNIFLNSQQYGCVSDLGLATLTSSTTPPVMQTAGYRAPEVTDTRKLSQSSDVYSYGVLLLQLLTRKSPIHATGGDEVVHLVRWVQSVVREEWTAEVFDVELLKYPNIEEEMVEMLQIGLACAVKMPEQRPKMVDILRRVVGIRRVGTGNRPS
ncbi:putative inactive receptor kinase [Camellia lanceoleosa]|nr:putative inactive receptor kinase [Camellia lanceoleosa]